MITLKLININKNLLIYKIKKFLTIILIKISTFKSLKKNFFKQIVENLPYKLIKIKIISLCLDKLNPVWKHFHKQLCFLSLFQLKKLVSTNSDQLSSFSQIQIRAALLSYQYLRFYPVFQKWFRKFKYLKILFQLLTDDKTNLNILAILLYKFC